MRDARDGGGLIWFIWSIWFNQTNETDQINKRDQPVLAFHAAQSTRCPLRALFGEGPTGTISL